MSAGSSWDLNVEEKEMSGDATAIEPKNPNADPNSEEPREENSSGAGIQKSSPRRGWRFFWCMALLLLSGAFYLSWPPYTAHTTVLLTLDRSLGEAERSAILDRELHILQSEELRRAVARSLSVKSVGNWPSGLGSVFSWPERPATFGDLPGQDWRLDERVTVIPTLSGSGALVKVTASGSNPDDLKKAIGEYVSQYVDYRRSSGPTARGEPRDGSQCSGVPLDDSIREITSRIERMRLTENQCELALGFLDNKSGGNFRSFIPSSDTVGLPALKLFQDRIVELEIKSRELAVHFTPQSSERKTIELQITGIRKAMKEYLAAQVQFLRRNRESLMAQKAEMLHNRCASSKEPARPASWEVQNEGTNRTYSVVPGLQVRVDEPSVSCRPVIAHLEALKAALLARLQLDT